LQTWISNSTSPERSAQRTADRRVEESCSSPDEPRSADAHCVDEPRRWRFGPLRNCDLHRGNGSEGSGERLGALAFIGYSIPNGGVGMKHWKQANPASYSAAIPIKREIRRSDAPILPSRTQNTCRGHRTFGS